EDAIPLNQFAVLVADRFQAARTSDYLKQYNIPCITQRSGSLTESPALSALIDILKGVLNPYHESSLKTALGGKIIRWTHNQVRELVNPEKLEKVLYPFLELKRTLINDGMTSFYQHLMQTSWHEDGLTILERLLSQEGSAEFYHDLQQIAEILFEYEITHRPAPEGYLGFLGQFKTLFQDDDKRVMKLLDPTKQAVNIMTLHGSKGLEFDIVFTLGLLKRTRVPEQFLPLKKDNHRYLGVVHDKTQQEYKQHCFELDAEKIRQLYVGMTRARYRLYNPVAIVPRSKSVKLGCASPMELFLGKLENSVAQGLCHFLDTLPEDVRMTYTLLHETPSILTSDNEKEQVDLQQPPKVTIPGTEKYIHSFSSLNTKTPAPFSDKNPPHDFFAEVKTPHTLPSGSETGNLLHKCLEKLPSGFLQPSELKDVIKPYLLKKKYQEWDFVLAEMLYNAMSTPLAEGLRLADVDPNKCFRETEFLYECGVKNAPGYLKGFIDLVFEYQDKYYLLDWKSNWLGSECQDYREEVLMKAMEEHNYYFQAQLYKDALKRYLRVIDNRPFEEIFGGVFYVFLRGLNPQFGNQFGVLRL
ncbi:MAG: 3'-5' exonuclease, partial [Waddliaceae bacterium]